MSTDQRSDWSLRSVHRGDYQWIAPRLDEWWGGRSMAAMLPRLFFEHFPTTTIVAAADSDDRPVGFLCAFRSQADSQIAYIHFVGVDPAYRGGGMGRAMYGWFFTRAGELGCRQVECVTSPVNTASRRFHAALGFSEERIDDYDGPGEHRMKMHRTLD